MYSRLLAKFSTALLVSVSIIIKVNLIHFASFKIWWTTQYNDFTYTPVAKCKIHMIYTLHLAHQAFCYLLYSPFSSVYRHLSINLPLLKRSTQGAVTQYLASPVKSLDFILGQPPAKNTLRLICLLFWLDACNHNDCLDCHFRFVMAQAGWMIIDIRRRNHLRRACREHLQSHHWQSAFWIYFSPGLAWLQEERWEVTLTEDGDCCVAILLSLANYPVDCDLCAWLAIMRWTNVSKQAEQRLDLPYSVVIE